MASTVSEDAPGSKLPEYSRLEVKKHNSTDDIWVIISNEIYDLTTWIGKHPGGSRILEVQAGYDVTTPFLLNHTPAIRKRANAFKIGVLKTADHEDPSELANDLLALRETLREEGWYKTDLWYVKWRAVFYSALFVGAFYFVAKRKAVMCQVFGAVLMALFLQQMAFIGHDLGHGSITNDRYLDYLWGSGLMSIVGLGVSWWKINHQTHHVVTNSMEHDPDIQHLPFLSISREQLVSAYWSKYYRKWFEFDQITKFLIKYQHWSMIIVLCFSRFNLYVHSVTTLFTEKHVPLINRNLELVGWCVYCCWQYVFYRSAGSFQRSLLVFFITHAVCGILLSIQIGISHWISPVFHFHPDRKNWFRQQLQTTIDIDCYRMNDWFHGGLQFQVAHHIFPALPRCFLRRARDRIKQVLKKHDVEYQQLTFIEMLVKMWGNFARVADEASKLPLAYAPKKEKLY